MIQIAVLGYGTIGSGVVEVLKVNKESITKRVGDEISIKYILDLREFPGDPMEDRIVHDYAVIKNDPEIADRGGSHGWCGAGIHICETGA